jgi:hypothetical protein
MVITVNIQINRYQIRSQQLITVAETRIRDIWYQEVVTALYTPQCGIRKWLRPYTRHHMVMSLVGLETKDHCARQDQQQLKSQPAIRVLIPPS